MLQDWIFSVDNKAIVSMETNRKKGIFLYPKQNKFDW